MLGRSAVIARPADLGLALALAGAPTTPSRCSSPPRGCAAPMPARARISLWRMPLAATGKRRESIAAQDLPADQVEARMAEWLAMVAPGQASAQVAAFIGIRPIGRRSRPADASRLGQAGRARSARRPVAAPQPAPGRSRRPVAAPQPARRSRSASRRRAVSRSPSRSRLWSSKCSRRSPRVSARPSSRAGAAQGRRQGDRARRCRRPRCA